METRILIPNGLQVIVVDDENVKLRKRKHPRKSIVTEEENEKPSSSSGHFETGDDPIENDKIKAYKSCSSSSTLNSSSNSDASNSSPSETEGESEISISRNSPKSEDIIGSSETVSTRKRKKKGRRNNARQERKNYGENEKQKTGQSKVRICATRLIEKGTVFTPNDGDVQVVKLKGIPAIPRDDVRFIFGCFETIAPSTPLTPTSPPAVSSAATTTSPETTDNNFIRLCNWIRFLPSTESSEKRTSSCGTLSTDASDTEIDDTNCSDKDHDPDFYASSDNKDWNRNKRKNVPAKSCSLLHANLCNENSNFLTNPPQNQGKRRHRHRKDQRYSNNLGKSLKANNIIARFVDGRPVFEATTRLVPGTELVAYFDMSSFNPGSSSPNATSTFNVMMGSSNPSQTGGKQSTHGSNAISSPSPPPAPSSSTSTSISSSSSSSLVGVGRGKNNGKETDRDERGQPIQHSLFHCYPSYALHHHHYYHQQQQPLFPSLFNDEQKQSMNYFLNRFAGNAVSVKDEIDHEKFETGGSKSEVDAGALMGIEDGEGRKQRNMSTDGPLDLTKLSKDPKLSKLGIKTTDSSEKASFKIKSEPLKIGTPFDSPDSNDDDKLLVGQGRDFYGKEVRGSSRVIHGKSTPSNIFSIRNVLKHESSPSPPPSSATTKLFQPYCFDDGEKGKDIGWKRGSSMQHGTLSQKANLNRFTPLAIATPPQSHNRSSASPTGIQTSSPAIPPVLRPILRTRGRERSLLPCEVCGKAFDRPSLLKRHLRTHTGEKPHVCDVCSKGFSTSSSLNTHRRIHSGEKPHQCPICGKRFTASSNLYYHRMTHNKEKPHKCMLCGKSFPTPGDLKSHQYVHSGTWPYTCPVCHRGFSKQTNLRNHLLLHSGMGGNSISNKPGEKQHSCHICEKKFALASNLRAHIKTHEETDPASSTCITCKRSFLPSLNMLVNGRCRTCIYNAASTNSDGRITIDSQRSSDTTSPQNVHLNRMEKVKSNFPTMSMESELQNKLLSPNPIHGMSQLPPQQNPLSSFALPQLSTFPMSGLPGALSLPGNALSAPGFHFPPTSSINPTATPNSVTAAAAALFRNAGGGTPATNPFIEHLLELNYRYAKETAGNLSLSIMQQKLLESQMFAAQLMTSQGFGMNGASTTTLQDILKFRAAAAGAEGFRQLDSVGTENKFMQR